MRRFRLLSLIVAMLTASGLLSLNFLQRLRMDGTHRLVHTGWPFEAMLKLDDSEFRDRIDVQPDGTTISYGGKAVLILGSTPPIQYSTVPSYNTNSIVLNILVCMSLTIVSLVSCEMILRRHDARAKPEVPA